MPQARTHIWTFAAGATEATVTNFTTNCPCSNAWAIANATPAPSFVGDNYFCESGNSGGGSPGGVVYTGDPLWGGEQCEGECCSNGKSPPWFSVSLPNPTSDDIEVQSSGQLSIEPWNSSSYQTYNGLFHLIGIHPPIEE